MIIHIYFWETMWIEEISESRCVFLSKQLFKLLNPVQCLLYLYTLKLFYPTKFVLLRGNHECRHLTEYFTFKRECESPSRVLKEILTWFSGLHKYSQEVYEAAIQSFCALPIAALVDGRFFCIHGGLSPELVHLSDLTKVVTFSNN